MSGGRVLVVDADYDILDVLATALRARGHHVALATDGRAGLQSAVEMSAEVVVVDRDVRVLDVRTFIDVLRDNPRTSGAQMFVMGAGDPAHLSVVHGRAEPIVKPFNADEIAARIDEVFRHRDAPAREQELRGELSQVSLFDLLQVFSVNRRTGKLVVESPEAAGEVWLARGEIVDASQGYAEGEKAIYRVLAVRAGQFLFVPEVECERRRVHAHVDQLLMEAARRVDEMARLKKELPPFGATVAAAPSPAPASGLAAELLGYMTEPRTIEELLDLLPAYDVEILEAVRDLLGRGALAVFDVHEKALFAEPAEAASLRAAMLRLRRPGFEGPIRMGVLAGHGLDAPRFARALNAVREFFPAPVAPAPAGDGYFGSLGALRLGGTELELLALPMDRPLRPLWGAMLASATVVLVLGEATPEPDVEALLRGLELRVVHVPGGFERPDGAVAALREALGATAARAPYAAPR
jgi:CheY-like chemotaxis protein